jgi:hypothetical protein
MSKLSDQIISLIAASGISNDDQRSAIGMARSWIDGHELKLAANSLDLKPKRDKLAVDIVALMEANPAENEEHIEALSEARKVVNAPFQAARINRKELLKPRDMKKAREGKQ